MLFGIFDRFARFVEEIIYGAEHLNTRHIPAKIGQIWESPNGLKLQVLYVCKGHVTSLTTDSNTFSLYACDSEQDFKQRIKDSKFHLTNK